MSEAQVVVGVSETDVSVEVKNIIEALIFASDEPLTVKMIRAIVDEANKERLPNEQIAVTADVVRKAVADLNRGYGRLGSGFRIIEIAGGFVYATQEQFAAWVGKLAKEKARRRLSSTAVETLAIIAYKQPITKSEVEFIRGVNVDYIINALLEKGLIQIVGRQNSPGRPLLYGTTQKFLEHFGLNELSDLPKPREIAELINETEAEVDRRLLAEQQELEFKESLEGNMGGHKGTVKKEKKPQQPKLPMQSGNAETPRETTVTESEVPGSQQLSAVEQQPEKDEQSPVAVEEKPEIQVPESAESLISAVEEVRSENVVEEHERSVVELPLDTLKTEQKLLHVEPSSEHETDNTVKVFSEEGETVSTQRGSITEEIEHLPLEANQPHEGESGWSRWKSKVKSFFKKLFG
ncbi:MAG: SMC-Scp complex subunit ScpB [Bacteroidota bacterium]